MLPTVLVLKNLLWGIQLRDYLSLAKISYLFPSQCVDLVTCTSCTFHKIALKTGTEWPPNQVPALFQQFPKPLMSLCLWCQDLIFVFTGQEIEWGLEWEGGPLWLSNPCRDCVGFGRYFGGRGNGGGILPNLVRQCKYNHKVRRKELWTVEHLVGSGPELGAFLCHFTYPTRSY